MPDSKEPPSAKIPGSLHTQLLSDFLNSGRSLDAEESQKRTGDRLDCLNERAFLSLSGNKSLLCNNGFFPRKMHNPI